MCLFDCEKPKKSLPALLVLLIVAQINLACAAGWPRALLALLHLTPAPNDLCRGACSGIGITIDVVVIFQLARILVRRRLQSSSGLEHD